MVSSTFFIVLCGLLLVSTEALRFGNRNGPGNRWNIDDNEQENGEQDRSIDGPRGGRGDRGDMHGHGHGKGFGLPFLANATDEERDQFLAIFKNRTLDKASKEAAIEALVATLDPAIQEAYKTWKQEKEAALAQKVAALSPEARQAYDALQQLEKDTTLSAEEKRTQIREFFRNQTDEVRRELRGLMWSGKKGFGGGRFGGRWGGSGENGDRFGSKRHEFSFLSNITDPTILAEFRAIFRNRSLDRAAKESAIEELVATLDPSIQQAYNEWKAQREADLAAKVAALSPDARTAYDSLKAIKDNTALSAEEKKTQIKALMDSLTQEIRDELRRIFGDHHGGHGGGGRGGEGDRERGDLDGDNTGNGGFGRGGRGYGRRNFGGRF